jgi:hypothetical protein
MNPSQTFQNVGHASSHTMQITNNDRDNVVYVDYTAAYHLGVVGQVDYPAQAPPLPTGINTNSFSGSLLPLQSSGLLLTNGSLGGNRNQPMGSYDAKALSKLINNANGAFTTVTDTEHFDIYNMFP